MCLINETASKDAAMGFGLAASALSMKDFRYHLSVKKCRAIWSAGMGLSEIVFSEDETI